MHIDDNFFAILYKRILLYEDYIIFIPCHYVEGYYDKSDKSFIDNSNIPYYSCDNYSFVNSGADLTYYYDISIKDLENRYNESATTAIGKFYEEIKKVLLIGHIVDKDKKIEILEISFEKLRALSKKIVYNVNDENCSVTLDKLQLECLLNESDPDKLRKRLKLLLKGIDSILKINTLQSNSTLITNTASAVVSSEKKDTDKRISTKEAAPVPSLEIPNSKVVFDNVTKSLIGQDDSVQDIITAIINNMNATEPKELIKPLLIGQTGSGKTLLFDLISKQLNISFMPVDCNQLVQAGYVGTTIDMILRDLYLLCGRNKDKTEHALVFFDEIDKLASRGAEVSDIGVQNALLKFIEGQKFVVPLDQNGTNKVIIDTSMMNIAAGGAFEEIIDKKEKSMGFNSLASDLHQEKLSTKDLVDYGMISQLIGRFNLCVQYNKVTEEMIRTQLLTSDISQLEIKKRYFLRNYGAQLVFTDDFISRICKTAIERKTGFRGINEVVNRSLSKVAFSLQSDMRKDLKIIISSDTLDNPKEYKITKNS